MKETFFFDIPVYRIPRDKYYAEMDSYLEKTIFSGSPEHVERVRAFHDRNPGNHIQMQTHLRKKFGGMWEINEVIGQINLHFSGTQIIGEYFRVDAKIIRKTRSKTFEYRTHKLAPEIDIPINSINEVIYGLILEYIERCRQELKGRYIDSTSLETIGPHINWKAIFETHNTFPSNSL